MLYGWKENSMLTNCLAACAHLAINVSEIERDMGRKSSLFHTPLAFDAPVKGVPVGIAPPRLVWKDQNGLANRWLKNFEDIFIRFGATHKRDRQTDGRTPRAGISRLCIASRGKKTLLDVLYC